MYEFIQVGNAWKVVWGPIPAELSQPECKAKEVTLRDATVEERLERYTRIYGCESLFTLAV